MMMLTAEAKTLVDNNYTVRRNGETLPIQRPIEADTPVRWYLHFLVYDAAPQMAALADAHVVPQDR